MRSPVLHIIAGCNGAGKTTAAMKILPDVYSCLEYVNADEIAKGISPFDPESVAVAAGRIMLQRINELVNLRKTFAIETTLATRSFVNLIHRVHKLGYRVSLLFFWLESPEMAEHRVAQRVAAGGHNIPNDVIHRRYWRGLNNLFDIYVPIVDEWSLFDNCGVAKPIVISNNIVDHNLYYYVRSTLAIGSHG